MHAVVRTYSGKGAKELLDVAAKHKQDLDHLFRSIKGFVSYTLARTSDGGISVTVCEDKAGVDESVHKAREWIAKNAANTGVAAPKVAEGSVILNLK
jgi:hypothetical protein